MDENKKCACGDSDPACHIRCIKSGRTQSYCIACFEEMIISGDYKLVDAYENTWKVISEEEL